MKRIVLFALVSLAVTVVLSCMAFAAPALVSDEGTLSADLDLNVSELFVVERGYAVPFVEEELPAEYLMHDEVGYEMWHMELYLIENDEFVFAPVLAYEGGQELIVGGTLSSAYNKQYCKYTLYTSGIYVIEPVTANTDASVLDGNDENALYSATLDRNVKFNKVDGAYDTYALENANIDKRVVMDENTLIFAWQYNEYQDTYELVIFDKDIFADLPEGEYANINYVVKNNPDPDKADTLLYMISYKAVTTVENLRIVSLSTPGVDENGKYRNYYELFNPCTGTKEYDVAGNLTSDSGSDLPEALEAGLVVAFENGELVETQTPAGIINPVDTSKGIVWISGYDDERNTISVVPTYVTEDACCKEGYLDALNGYVFDAENPDFNFDGKQYNATADGKIEYKLTSNTVVTVLEYSDLNAITKWGFIKLGEVDKLVSGKQYYKCYNYKFVDDSGNLKTKIAKNVMAYVYGEDSIADLVIVVVGELPANQNGMFYSKADCETAHDPYTIDGLIKIDGENGKFSYKLDVTNNSHVGNALLIICTYDADGVLVNSYFKTTTAEIGETDTFTTVEIADGERKVASAKAFVFDELKLLSPLAKAIEK